jgi:histidinol-phosphate aminotransferase
MSWVTAIARSDIRAMKAYEHASWEPGLIRMHANERPWRASYDTSGAGLNRYPEPHPHELTAALAKFYGVDAKMLLACRGSDEAIDLLIRCYCHAGQDAVTICPPTFGMYSVAARVQGATVIDVPLLREADFDFDMHALLAHRDSHVKLVFLCSPNNPTGNRLDSAAILGLARALDGRALVVVDEAYVEFADAPSLIAQIATHPGLVILRTLSKAYGLAGARCGALIAHPDIVALLRKVIQPYAITQLTIEAVFKALEPAAIEEAMLHVSTLKHERTRVSDALEVFSETVQVWPSQANFLLVEFKDAGVAWQKAYDAGLLVRDMRHALGLSRALRITLGTAVQNNRLLQILE